MLASFDAITRFLFSINDNVIPGITAFSYFLDLYTPLFLVAPLAYLFFTLAAAVYRGKDPSKIVKKESWLIKAILAMILSVLISFFIKSVVKIPRPCILDPSYTKVYCPSIPDYSFPSAHTAIASAFLASQVGSLAFLPFFIINLLIGFSRINLGVHFLNDVLAGFVIGFFSYDIVNRFLSSGTLTLSKPKHIRADFEFRRQLLHILVGVLLVMLLLGLTYVYGTNGQIYTEFLVFILIQVMLFVINDRMLKREGSISKIIFAMFERTGVSPGYGAFWYGMGTLFLLVFINNPNFLIASILALSVGDGMATLIGVQGKHRNPLNPEKTIDGSSAFFISTAIITYPFIGMLSIPFGLLTSFVESLPPKFDDNFTIPLVSILFFVLV